MSRYKQRIAAAAAAAAMASVPGVAVADSGTPGAHSAGDAVYGPGILGDEPSDSANGTNAVNAAVPVHSDDGGNVVSLPFTGYAAGAVLLIGLAMLLAGVVGRRLSRPRP
jgi:hypothetical protein